MDSLAQREHWEKTFRTEIYTSFYIPRLKFLRRLLGDHAVEYFYSYADYLQWKVIYPKYLSQRQGQRIVEIGSAPGDHLVRLASFFGLIPYGIEYTQAGAKLNQQLFEQAGIPKEQVIIGDFFSPEIQNQYAQFFDIVLSRGFLEHFENPKTVIQHHLHLLKPGGLLIVTIPNLRGFVNHFWVSRFSKEELAIHNLAVMEKKAFASCFDFPEMIPIYCSYFGTLNFNLWKADQTAVAKWLLNQFKNLQLICNVLCRLILRKRGLDLPCISPYLIFIGQKKA